MHGRGNWSILLRVRTEKQQKQEQAKTWVDPLFQLPRNRRHCLLYPQHRKPYWRNSIRIHLSNRLGLRHRHRLCHHHLRPNLRRSLQPGHNDLLRHLARVSLEESPPLYLQPDLWRVHRRSSHGRHVLARDSTFQRAEHRRWERTGVQRRSGEYTLYISESYSDVSFTHFSFSRPKYRRPFDSLRLSPDVEKGRSSPPS